MDHGEIRKIIHVDMDAFFASVEQRDNPELRGKPIAVGGSSRRGVVAAASYEARRFGVCSAMPSVTAARRCPELIFVKPRFDIYREVSRQIRAIFAGYTDLIEPLSLDEAYLDVTEDRCGLRSATETARVIRARIRAEIGLTASAGISYNKFLAKLGSDQNKPDGQFVITPAHAAAFIESLDVARFHGVGRVTAAKLNRLGIFTGADLRRQSLAFLQAHFGKSGEWYHAIARGRDDRPVRSDRPRKSSGSARTYFEDLVRAAQVEDGVAAMADEVWRWCEKARTSGRTVTVKIKYADFQQITRSRTLESPIAHHDGLRRISVDLVRTIFPLRKGVRLLGVTISNLQGFAEAESEQLALNM